MKKVILTAVAVFGFAFANAQENSIKVNPLAIIGGTDLISYEHKFGDNTSGVVGLGYASYKLGGYKYTDSGAELQYRYYFDEAMKGFYGGLRAGYSSGKTKVESSGFGGVFEDTNASSETKFTSIKGGIKGGYQWLWDSGFTLDLNIGLGYNKFTYKYDASFDAEDINLLGFKGSYVGPNFGFALGYSF